MGECQASRSGYMWGWTVCDAKTKLIPVIQLDPRTQDMAHMVVHKMKSLLLPGWVPTYSLDGLKHYFYALTAHFGEWVQAEGQSKPLWMVLASFAYAQVVKHQRRFRLIKVERRMVWGVFSEYSSRLNAAGLSGNINSSFVERANLTIRQSISKLTRRTWGPAQSASGLSEHLFWWQAYYHFSISADIMRVCGSS